MLFIFDLDFTLFDAEGLKADLAEALGISYDRMMDTYYEYFRLPRRHYSPFEHLGLLAAADPMIDQVAARDRLNALGQRMDHWLYPDSIEVLSNLKSAGHELALLTMGHQEWQGFKVDNLSIKQYFSNIIITQDKIASLAQYADRHSEMIIVNDNGQECLDIIDHYQPRDVVLVEGPYTYNATHTLPVRKLVDCLDISFPSAPPLR